MSILFPNFDVGYMFKTSFDSISAYHLILENASLGCVYQEEIRDLRTDLQEHLRNFQNERKPNGKSLYYSVDWNFSVPPSFSTQFGSLALIETLDVNEQNIVRQVTRTALQPRKRVYDFE